VFRSELPERAGRPHQRRRANDYIYVIVQPQIWAPLAELIGRPELADHPDWARPEDRLPKLDRSSR